MSLDVAGLGAPRTSCLGKRNERRRLYRDSVGEHVGLGRWTEHGAFRVDGADGNQIVSIDFVICKAAVGELRISC